MTRERFDDGGGEDADGTSNDRRRADERRRDRDRDERIFVACTAAVNTVLGRTSTRHGGQPCPARTARARDGRVVLAYCGRGCFDEVLDLLADVLRRVDGRKSDTVDGYAMRTATAALGDLHRARRKQLGLPQRPERVADAGWAERILPDRADRALFAHLLTWLGSDAPAAGGAGWPVGIWAIRYGVPERNMATWLDRVLGAVRTADPQRYLRYVADPLAAKPRTYTLFSDIQDVEHAIREHAIREDEEDFHGEALCAG
jgi:hypothetical protein